MDGASLAILVNHNGLFLLAVQINVCHTGREREKESERLIAMAQRLEMSWQNSSSERERPEFKRHHLVAPADKLTASESSAR